MITQRNMAKKDTATYVGRDHLGNHYYEKYQPNHQFRKNQRYFIKEKVESFDELVDATHVPPAWDAWLRFRRKEPPSTEEVEEGEEYYKIQQERAAQLRGPVVKKGPRNRE